ncbi:MAG: hypothetical protein QM681_07265 [Novosphingobium sp.]
MTLGRIGGALSYCSEATLRVLAGRALRHTLIAALRQEGHAFTEMRFHAWFAGLTTLCDDSPRSARPARALSNAILTELANWGDTAIAEAAGRLKTALLAPLESHDENANAEAGRTLEAARLLVAAMPSMRTSPFTDLATLHHAIAESVEFAPPERTTSRLATPLRQFEIAVPSPKAPLWAIDLIFSRRLCEQHNLHPPFPFPGLARADAVGEADAPQRRFVLANAMQDAVGPVLTMFQDADALARIAHAPAPGRRGNSRAPQLMELLAGFGPLRSRQIETMLGASRLGVAGMVESWEALGAIGRTTISGSHLLEMRTAQRTSMRSAAPELPSFSMAALADYESSMEAIDRLLARHGNDEHDGGST